jgi:hypothetical protein
LREGVRRRERKGREEVKIRWRRVIYGWNGKMNQNILPFF